MVNFYGIIDANFDYEFDINEIRTIIYEMNYFTSIKLLMDSLNPYLVKLSAE